MAVGRTSGLSEEVARAALAIQLPDEHASTLIDRACVGFADTIGVALAGRSERSRQLALEWARAAYGATGDRSAPVWGESQDLSSAGAAYVNGVAAHALDFDDVAPSVGGHPSAVLVPVLMSLAASRKPSGRELLEAYLVGIHITSSVALGFDLEAHYGHGWHATVTVGSLGAVAAGCRLLRLDATQTTNALGICASTAAGTRENFGSMVKPLHVGMAAANVVMACELAAGGFEASPKALDGPLGFLELYAAGSTVDVAAAAEALALPLTTFAGGTCTKKYPCCYQTHRALDAAIALRRDLDPARVRRVKVTVEPEGDNSLIHANPTESAQGRFSMQYTVATALVDGAVTFDSFEPAALERDDVRRLMRAVEVSHAATPPIGEPTFAEHYAFVELSLDTGETRSERCDVARGDSGNPLTVEDLIGKLGQCLKFGGYDLDPVRLHEMVQRLGSGGSVTALQELVAAEPTTGGPI